MTRVFPKWLRLGKAQIDSAVVFHGEEISNEADLVRTIDIERPLCEELNLARGLWQHICPVETPSASRQCVILVSTRYKNSDELQEVIR